jgi:aminoglycoside/choline kinase family phosphotransferase
MERLSPAQTQFLKKNIYNFQIGEWSVGDAGYAGSERRFLRIRQKSGSQGSFILILWDSRDSDWSRFLAVQKELRGVVPFLPDIFASDDVHGLILEEDLGNTTLKSIALDHPENVERAYESVLEALIAWQKIATITSAAIASRSMDLEVFLWESRYFALHCVTEFYGCDSLLTPEWEKERTQIALEASSFPKVYIHRDFQSENILIDKGAVRFVDFQGARLGPAGYDVASLLYDPYIPQLENGLSEKLFDYYQSKTYHAMGTDSFYICSLQRLMQALGAYGNLSIHKGKERYRQFIPIAVNRCIKILEKMPRFPQLRTILCACRDKK